MGLALTDDGKFLVLRAEAMLNASKHMRIIRRVYSIPGKILGGWLPESEVNFQVYQSVNLKF
jgi:hypothetical protein